MSEYIFVTNIFEYSNIRIYSSHSGVNLLVDGVDLLGDGGNLLGDGFDLLGDGVDLLGDGVNLLGDSGNPVSYTHLTLPTILLV